MKERNGEYSAIKDEVVWSSILLPERGFILVVGAF